MSKGVYDAAKALRSLKKPMYIGMVNVLSSPELTEKYKISMFPSFLYFKKGQYSSMFLGNTKKEIIDFMEQHSVSTTKRFKKTGDLKKFLSSNSFVVVGYFTSQDSSEYSKWYEPITSILELATVLVTEPSVLLEMGISKPSVVFYKNLNDMVVYDGQPEGLKQWVQTCTLPTVIPFTEVTARILFSPEQSIKTHLILFAPLEEPGKVMEVAEAIGKKYSGQLFVVHVRTENSYLISYFGLQNADFPKFLLVDLQEVPMKKYLYNGDISEHMIEHFIENVFAGNISPFLKSAPEAKQVEVIYVRKEGRNEL